MSFQGSLGTLELTEVVGLLAATRKTGELHIAGNRTAGLAQLPLVQGDLWFDAGRLAAADIAGETDMVDAMVELLRLVEGTFTFRPGPAPNGLLAVEAADVVASAQERLAEWREIELVVPSQDAWLELNSEPSARHVVVRADQWRLIVAIGAGNSVRGTVDRLGVGELAGWRAVKELVDSGLVNVHRGGSSVPADEPALRESRHVSERPGRTPALGPSTVAS